MFGTVSHGDDEENRDSSSPSGDRKGADQKVHAVRTKHSETEQRRRSKINERFQILRDLIPENDRKRDKASFLLEVIQHIRYLHDKLQLYEGSCQGWSPESTKSFPWRINSGPVESFVDQSQLDRNLSGHEDINVFHPTLLSNVQSSVESDLVEAPLYTSTDNAPMATKGIPLNLPLPASTCEGLTGQSHQGSFHDVDNLIHHSQHNLWPARSSGDDCSGPIYATNEEVKNTSGESSTSNAHSQELLNSLTNALQSSGVDLSQVIISVQLDVGKRTNSTSSSMTFDFKDDEKAPGLNYGAPMDSSWNNECPGKRFKSNQS